ncbi:hypothetical protein [Chitinophaga polysaccharea]|uniref:hypothetical protein n=1 Tax=Chitinophaga polysaccharea TaxID=1293035 RepID=UPI0011576D31|nr:hypothetical protein [Chitinophaga polysaccharea]
MQQQQENGTSLRFRNTRPVKLLVGYFDTKEKTCLQAPDLETDASADDKGQATVRMVHALSVSSMPPVNVHTYYFDTGEHTFILGKGACLLLGFINGDQEISRYNTNGKTDSTQQLDWLFEK